MENKKCFERKFLTLTIFLAAFKILTDLLSVCNTKAKSVTQPFFAPFDKEKSGLSGIAGFIELFEFALSIY